MRFQGEVPPVENRRAGAGWWMDEAGVWRSPREWPEDYPPVPGWVRADDGTWAPPSEEELRRRSDTRWARVPDAVPAAQETRQARADKRDMLLVTGVLLGALVVLVGALILITQAGATDDDVAESTDPDSDVIFAAETEAALDAKRQAVAAVRPEWARSVLASLPVAAPVSDEFDADEWIVSDDGCLSVAEQVLISRSSAPVTFADQIECVLDTGRWDDRYVGREIERAIDAEVQHRVPSAMVAAAGGSAWDRATREAYLSDLAHPAMYEIVAANAGHNPQGEGPAGWRPASEATWCAYAIDWIAVKQRWSLGVDGDERAALGEMLATCEDPDSSGADPDTTPIEEPARPPIAFR